MMVNETTEQKSKILVKESKAFYLQTIFAIGLAIFLILRRQLMGNIAVPPAGTNLTMDPNTMGFMNNITDIYIMIVFLVIILYRYIKLYNLKKKFKNAEIGDEKLKKYMKKDEIPSITDVHTKFDEDKVKAKNKFYKLLLRVIAIDIILIILQQQHPSNFQWIDIIIIFTALTTFYRYLFIFHVDEKIFSAQWENEKMNKFIKELNE
ncbi:MAG: 2TM domain-containing protein [Methanobrevibacter sp.]|jgi:preprotein translocase subunit SecG|nr:2TM domain-containing protein [Methanobrevibacter sp.]